jgi:cytochrome P450
MLEATSTRPVSALPLAPCNPLPYRQRAQAARALATGQELLRDAGGPVTRVVLGPGWLVPEMVFVSSPQGCHDVLMRRDSDADRASLPMMVELRQLLGGNLLNLAHEPWLPRRRALQPMFSKQRVTRMTEPIIDAAEQACRRWPDRGTIDLDDEIRGLTIRALSTSFLGLDLGAQADSVSSSMHDAFSWLAGRSVTPVRTPMWLPTPGQRRARRGATVLHHHARTVLQACRTDPTRHAPAVRALMEARDPNTGITLSDNEICDELVMFMFGGHDTISTTLTYTLWALGRHPEIQERVAAEVSAIGDRPLTSDDIPQLGYTVQVLHEALRLFPPGPAIPRMVRNDIEVDGYRVEAGTFVIVSVYALHRDPEVWDDPLVFDPGRFDSQRSQAIDRWQYLPFSAGQHSCMGDHFAMLEATLALATIVRDVAVTTVGDQFPTAMTLTMVADGPIRAQVRARHVTG